MRKANALSLLPACHAKLLVGDVPNGCYADETPFVKAIEKAAGNIDAEYVYNDGRHDFARLERFFVAMDGPVRNPDQSGLGAGNSRARAFAGAACAARWFVREPHHKLERLVTNGHSFPPRQAVFGLSTMATILSQHSRIRAGLRCENFCLSQ